MAAKDFFGDEAKAQVRAAIERIEGQTSAEVVVTVRRRAGNYEFADLAFGTLAAFACLAVMIYSDVVFATIWIPIDVAIVFAIATVISVLTPTLRRQLCPPSALKENVKREATVAFHEQRIARTRGRNGILVLVGIFERRAAVVFDLGIDPAAVGPAFTEAVARIEGSVAGLRPDVATFIAALEALGPALAPTMPKTADDVNELPDDVGVA